MRLRAAILIGISGLVTAGTCAAQSAAAHLIVVDPGHFHATLLQREMYPELDKRVSVYSTLGPELVDYMNRIAVFNLRTPDPTHWELEVHTSDRPLERMIEAEAGKGGKKVVVFSGRNRGKIDGILASIGAGFNVLADKPWIIEASEFPKLEKALSEAVRRRVAAYDIMTERYDAANQVERALVNAPEVFGTQVKGDGARPGINARSVHHLMKVVGGVPLKRPPSFFDVNEQGEGMADVGVHPVDLIMWTMLPDQPVDYRKDIRMISARHEPMHISKAQFAAVTGLADFPASLAGRVHGGVLDYYCDNFAEYELRGVRIKLGVTWDWEAPPGVADYYEAAYQGTRARIEIRQGAAEKFVPEVYVIPQDADRAAVFSALEREMARLQSRWPGIAATHNQSEAHIEIPAKFRVTHEEHFAQVARHFFEYLHDPASMPAWENANMLAKYYVTTQAVAMARK